jgi:acetylornithine deacetylase/succinyl-diaminopimelate desuccinylase family protein
MIKDVTTLLSALIEIPSVNPNGTPGTDGINEETIAHFLADFLKKIGADEVTLLPVQPHRPNLLARFCGGRSQRPKTKPHRIAFAPHTDTVSVEGMTISPFTPSIKDGRLYGRGATDTKGPMAAMLWALKQWASSRSRVDSPHEILFYGLMGEEAGNEGAIAMAAHRPAKADFIIVGEPTEHRIVHAHKGAIWIELHTRGKACHASTPDRGKNAIQEMTAFLSVFSQQFPKFLKTFTFPTLGSPTFNIGLIRGGSKVNIVPDSCIVEIDCRSVPGLEPHAITQFIRSLAERLGIRIKTRIIGHRPPMHVPADHPWIAKLRPFATRLDVAPWFCDAAIFAQAGIPAVAFGPGSIRQAHTKDEYIKITDLTDGAARYSRFLASL